MTKADYYQQKKSDILADPVFKEIDIKQFESRHNVKDLFQLKFSPFNGFKVEIVYLDNKDCRRDQKSDEKQKSIQQ
jgi:hypothetical protein